MCSEHVYKQSSKRTADELFNLVLTSMTDACERGELSLQETSRQDMTKRNMAGSGLTIGIWLSLSTTCRPLCIIGILARRCTQGSAVSDRFHGHLRGSQSISPATACVVNSACSDGILKSSSDMKACPIPFSKTFEKGRQSKRRASNLLRRTL